MGAPNIVLLGGGTGSFTLLSGLKKLTPNLTAVVNMSDDGGSSGVLRDELGVLPPGDVRQCLVALSDVAEVRDLFGYRFKDGRLQGQSLGNIILSGLELQYDNFEEAIRVASTLLDVTGKVVPVTLQKHTLTLRDGLKVVKGEHQIDAHKFKHPNPVLRLQPAATASPAAVRAIVEADMVVIAPGSLYSSLLPICLVDGVAGALRRTHAKIVCVANLVNKDEQTPDWHVADYVRALEEYLGAGTIDIVLYNTQRITDRLLNRYAAKGEHPVRTDAAGFWGLHTRAIGGRLVSREIAAADPADTAVRRTLIRHDAERVCRKLHELLVSPADHRS